MPFDKKRAERTRKPRSHWEQIVSNVAGYVLIDVVYEKNKKGRNITYLLIRTPEGKKIKLTTYQWKKGVRSNYDRTIQDIEPFYREAGYELLETKYKNAKTKMKTKCPEGHEFLMHYNHFSSGVRCPECHGTPRMTVEELKVHPLILKEKYEVLDRVRHGNRLGMKVICRNKHEWVVSLPDFFTKGYRCPECNPQASRAELDLLAKVQEIYPDARKSREFGFELDILIKSQNLAIEYCGLYWHCDLYKDKNFHYEKFKKCQQNGIKLLTVFEDEWIEKPDIVLARIFRSKTIPARKLNFVQYPDRKKPEQFLKKNHLQGVSHNSILFFGLEQNGEIKAVMSFAPHHRSPAPGVLVLSRLCFGTENILGGSEKLFKNALLVLQELGIKKIISWSDNRYASGDVYEKLGFCKAAELRPDYFYCKPGYNPIRVSKQSMRKTPEERKLKESEATLRARQGWYRIWDCGKIRWEYTL